MPEADGDAKAARMRWCGVTMQTGEVVLLASVQSAMETQAPPVHLCAHGPASRHTAAHRHARTCHIYSFFESFHTCLAHTTSPHYRRISGKN